MEAKDVMSALYMSAQLLAQMSVPEDYILPEHIDEGDYPDTQKTDCWITYGDIRRARQAVANAKRINCYDNEKE